MKKLKQKIIFFHNTAFQFFFFYTVFEVYLFPY